MFVDDITSPDQYCALTVRAPAPNRVLKNICCPPLDSRYTLIRASDIPGQNKLAGAGFPALASQYISYAGEPVAVLTGPDMWKLEEIAAQIIVETAPCEDGAAAGKPPVFSITQAEAEIAAQIILDIEAFPKNAPPPKEKVHGAARTAPRTAPAHESSVTAHYVTGCYMTGIQAHWYGEPHGAVASIIGGVITVQTATQWPEHVRHSVAAALGLPYNAVMLETTGLAAHFDGKIWYPSLVAVHAALAAFITKRPVKLMLTHKEDFLFSPKRPETMIEFSTSLDSNGEPFETTVTILAGLGSEGFFSDEILRRVARAAAGPYRLGRIEVDARAVKTNLPPAGPFAGFGAAEGAFALERHIAKIADTARMEGLEWRGRHYSGKKPLPAEVENLIENLIARSDYRRKWAAYQLLRQSMEASGVKVSPMRGIGVTVFAHTDGRPRYCIDEGGCVSFDLKKPEDGAPPPVAAAVIELEIDGIDFSAKIRGIWVSVLSGRLSDRNAARGNLLKNIICALGWTTSEKLKYEEGRISESRYFEYDIPKPSAIPGIKIDFAEYDDNGRSAGDAERDDTIAELPYCVIPSSYLQALTQATGHHFETIPVSARDIWLVLDRREQEERGEKKE